MSFNICKPEEHDWRHQMNVDIIEDGEKKSNVAGIKRCGICKISKLYDMAKEEVK